MTSQERIEKAVKLETPDHVPVSPFIYGHTARVRGVSHQDVFLERKGKLTADIVDRSEDALRYTFEKYGGWDMPLLQGLGHAACGLEVFSIFPDPVGCFFFGMDVLGIDYFGDTQDTFRVVEEPMMDENGYDLLLEEGFFRFASFRKGSYLNYFQPFVLNEKLTSIWSYWHDEKKQPLAFGWVWPPPEMLCHIRKIKNFLLDVRRRPEKIKEVCDAFNEGFIEMGKLRGESIRKRFPHANIIAIDASLGHMQLMSPRDFEEIYFPYLKEMVEEFSKAGFVCQLHMDGDYTPVLEYFRELPRCCGWIEWDGFTNITKAKEILGDHLCIKGDVSATLLAHGTPLEVEKYCKKLIETCGKTGFILSSGCEVPINAKFENVKMMIDTAKTFGVVRK